MKKTKYIWMNGKLIKWNNAKIHVLSHSLHYGSAIFEGIRFYETKKGPAIFRLVDHIDRFFNSAKTIEMNIPFNKKEIIKSIIEIIKINKLKSGYIRPISFFGYGTMGLTTEKAPVNVSISVWSWKAYFKKEAIDIKISSYIKPHHRSTNLWAKISGNYQNSILASQEAKKEKYDEALLLDYKGNVAEGPGENIFIIKNNKLFTPSAKTILPGITRNSIIEIAKNENIGIKETILKPSDVYLADEAFFTGTVVEVTPISSINDKKIRYAPGETTNRLRSLYSQITHGKIKKYNKWLTFVK